MQRKLKLAGTSDEAITALIRKETNTFEETVTRNFLNAIESPEGLLEAFLSAETLSVNKDGSPTLLKTVNRQLINVDQLYIAFQDIDDHYEITIDQNTQKAVIQNKDAKKIIHTESRFVLQDVAIDRIMKNLRGYGVTDDELVLYTPSQLCIFDSVLLHSFGELSLGIPPKVDGILREKNQKILTREMEEKGDDNIQNLLDAGYDKFVERYNNTPELERKRVLATKEQYSKNNTYQTQFIIDNPDSLNAKLNQLLPGVQKKTSEVIGKKIPQMATEFLETMKEKFPRDDVTLFARNARYSAADLVEDPDQIKEKFGEFVINDLSTALFEYLQYKKTRSTASLSKRCNELVAHYITQRGSVTTQNQPSNKLTSDDVVKVYTSDTTITLKTSDSTRFGNIITSCMTADEDTLPNRIQKLKAADSNLDDTIILVAEAIVFETIAVLINHYASKLSKIESDEYKQKVRNAFDQLRSDLTQYGAELTLLFLQKYSQDATPDLTKIQAFLKEEFSKKIAEEAALKIGYLSKLKSKLDSKEKITEYQTQGTTKEPNKIQDIEKYAVENMPDKAWMLPKKIVLCDKGPEKNAMEDQALYLIRTTDTDGEQKIEAKTKIPGLAKNLTTDQKNNLFKALTKYGYQFGQNQVIIGDLQQIKEITFNFAQNLDRDQLKPDTLYLGNPNNITTYTVVKRASDNVIIEQESAINRPFPEKTTVTNEEVKEAFKNQLRRLELFNRKIVKTNQKTPSRDAMIIIGVATSEVRSELLQSRDDAGTTQADTQQTQQVQVKKSITQTQVARVEGNAFLGLPPFDRDPKRRQDKGGRFYVDKVFSKALSAALPRPLSAAPPTSPLIIAGFAVTGLLIGAGIGFAAGALVGLLAGGAAGLLSVPVFGPLAIAIGAVVAAPLIVIGGIASAIVCGGVGLLVGLGVGIGVYIHKKLQEKNEAPIPAAPAIVANEEESELEQQPDHPGNTRTVIAELKKADDDIDDITKIKENSEEEETAAPITNPNTLMVSSEEEPEAEEEGKVEAEEEGKVGAKATIPVAVKPKKTKTG